MTTRTWNIGQRKCWKPPPEFQAAKADGTKKLSRFNLTVEYIKGKDNVVADAMSRFAYQASQSFADVSWHRSKLDLAEMEAILAQEAKEEKEASMICLVTRLQEKTPPPPTSGKH